jgi:polysaccharide biosynthesis/export protein
MKTKLIGLGLTVVLSSLQAAAQPPAVPVTTERPSLPLNAVDNKSRILQIGDRLNIHVYSLPALPTNYDIGADGTIFHSFMGVLPASGKSVAQLETLIRSRLVRQLKNPAFRVNVISTAEATAAVLGEVKSQGKLKFPEGSTLLDLLAQAGGITDKADPDSAILWRGGKEIPVNLSQSGQAQMSKIKILNGDILYVNKGRRIGVSGEVQAKGVYSISSRSANAIEDAIKAAGGATETAARTRIQLVRPSLDKPITVNLLDPTSCGKLVLEDGDLLVVPSRRAIMLGAVAKQGPLPLTGSENLVDVVSSAGVSQGRLDSVVLIRAADVLAGNEKKEIYNLQETFKEGKQTLNVAVHDGDVIFIPAKEASQGILQGNIGQLLFLARSFIGL